MSSTKNDNTMSELDLTSSNPDLAGFDLEALTGLAAFPDGSGGGIWQLAWEMQLLRDYEARIALLRAFARKHQCHLARVLWDVEVRSMDPLDKDGPFVPMIIIEGYQYDRRRVEASEICSLWPDAKWSRCMPRYHSESDRTRDYTAVVDGVTLRITKAERLPEPVKVDRFAPCGPIKIKTRKGEELA